MRKRQKSYTCAKMAPHVDRFYQSIPYFSKLSFMRHYDIACVIFCLLSIQSIASVFAAGFLILFPGSLQCGFGSPLSPPVPTLYVAFPSPPGWRADPSGSGRNWKRAPVRGLRRGSRPFKGLVYPDRDEIEPRLFIEPDGQIIPIHAHGGSIFLTVSFCIYKIKYVR